MAIRTRFAGSVDLSGMMGHGPDNAKTISAAMDMASAERQHGSILAGKTIGNAAAQIGQTHAQGLITEGQKAVSSAQSSAAGMNAIGQVAGGLFSAAGNLGGSPTTGGSFTGGGSFGAAGGMSLGKLFG